MKEKPENPPAFPSGRMEGHEPAAFPQYQGLTTRDYFAATALPTAMRDIPFDVYGAGCPRTAPAYADARAKWHKEVAADCYLIADAMLAERAKA